MIVLYAAPAVGQVNLTPELAGDPLRPALDGTLLVTELATPRPGAVGAARVSWAHRPVVFAPDDGGPRVDVVEDVLAVHIGASWTSRAADLSGPGPVQVAISAPAFLVATGAGWTGSAPLLGDPMLTAKWRALGWGDEDQRLGIGLAGRAGVPLGASSRQLGYPNGFGEIGGIVEAATGPVLFAANGGFRVEPQADLGVQVLDDAVWFRAALMPTASERWWPAVEIVGHRPREGFVRGTGPLEGLIELHHRDRAGRTLDLAVGRGLTSGIGAPELRVVVGISVLAGGGS